MLTDSRCVTEMGQLAIPGIIIPDRPVRKQGRKGGSAGNKNQDAARRSLFKHLMQDPTGLLFPEMLSQLSKPLLPIEAIPAEYRSDRSEVVAAEEEENPDSGIDVAIPFEVWGEVWIEDANGITWSKESMQYLQNYLFWESMEEMTLAHNELDKWSVLKWVFRPAITKEYVWLERLGKSLCFEQHERDKPFGFRNCCMAARVNADVIRDGFERNLPAELIEAVLRVTEPQGFSR